MSRQIPRAVAALRSGRFGHPSPARRTAAALLAAGLLLGSTAALAAAQQSPDRWAADQRAALPSGLTVRLDFVPQPGVRVKAAPGKLAARTDGAPAYTDGMRPGDPAQTFTATPGRPGPEGSWCALGTLQLTFSRPVRNPRLQVSGLAALINGKSGSTGTAARLTVTGGSPSAPALVGRTGWPGWAVSDNTLAPTGDGRTDGDADGIGTLELAGTFDTATLRVDQRSTARSGSAITSAALHQAYTVTVDEELSTAPKPYGTASHLLSDLSLGADALGTGHLPARRAAVVARPLLPPGPDRAAEPEDPGPLVELHPSRARRSPFAGPARSELEPGRAVYQGTDSTIGFPAEAAAGRYFHVTVPVRPGPGPATLAGWIDFTHDGRFAPADRVQVDIPPGATSATLEWTVPDNAAGGETWARFRLAREPAQLVSPSGYADSGEVLDQRFQLQVGAPTPEIAEPINGAVLDDTRPEITGDGAVPAATVAVTEGDSTLCQARAGYAGDWSCRPDTPLCPGNHTLTPIATTQAGMVLRGDAIRIAVKTALPSPPTLTVPGYTNDPGLLLTGTGEPGSSVTVTETSGAGFSGAGASDGDAELCTTAVADDRTWSCLPVENLAEGAHRLAPVAVDAAGNRTVGRPATLVVDTVSPDRPVLDSPAPGTTVRSVRPRFTGRAEPGATVIVTARSDGGGRQALCSAAVAVDGSWVCAAAHDLAEGEQSLMVVVTDRAGNETAGDPVMIRVALPIPTPSPSTSPSPSASPSPSVAPAYPPSPAPSIAPSEGPEPSSASSGSASRQLLLPVGVPPAPSVAPAYPPSPAPSGAPEALVERAAPRTPPSGPANPTASPAPSVTPSVTSPAVPSGKPLVEPSLEPPVEPPMEPSVEPSVVSAGTPVPPSVGGYPAGTVSSSASPVESLAQPSGEPSAHPSLRASRRATPGPSEESSTTLVESAEAVQAARPDTFRLAVCGAALVLACLALAGRRILGRGSDRRRR